jgi:uncharacterized protein YaiI (UPF0178 family)
MMEECENAMNSLRGSVDVDGVPNDCGIGPSNDESDEMIIQATNADSIVISNDIASDNAVIEGELATLSNDESDWIEIAADVRPFQVENGADTEKHYGDGSIK